MVVNARGRTTNPQPMRRATAGAERRCPRLAIELPGSLSGRSPRPVTLTDLSLTGCLVRCESLLEPGAIFDLGIKAGAHYLTTKVRVAESYVDGTAGGERVFLAGLEFLGLPARDEARLRHFLDDERRRRSAHAAPP